MHSVGPAIKVLADEALVQLNPKFDALYARNGRPSTAPEMLLQVFFSIRSERRLVERIDWNMLFRRLVGLGMDMPAWHATVFTHNRDELFETDVACTFCALRAERRFGRAALPQGQRARPSATASAAC